MNRPPAPSCLFLGATAGLVFCADVAAAAPKPAEAPAVEQAKPGWMSRLSATPKKLAFWSADKTPAPAPAPASLASAAKPESGAKPGSVAKPGSAAKPGSGTKPAVRPPVGSETPSVEAAATTKKKSFLTRLPSLPSLPFLGKPAEVEAGILSEGESSAGGTVTGAGMGRRGEGGGRGLLREGGQQRHLVVGHGGGRLQHEKKKQESIRNAYD